MNISMKRLKLYILALSIFLLALVVGASLRAAIAQENSTVEDKSLYTIDNGAGWERFRATIDGHAITIHMFQCDRIQYDNIDTEP